ncbi:MAG TPA: hypothetical protein VF746_15885 [Longimicrobium sp.]
MKPRFSALALALFAAVPAAAQQRTTPLETAPAAPVLRADTVPDTAAVRPMRRGERLAIRTAGGSLGWLLGGVGGVFAGLALEGESEGEWDGLDDAAIGFLVGTTVGGAVGAALPSYRGECRFGARFARGLLGSAVGTAVGLAFASSADDAVPLLFIPVTGGLGAALGADC